MKNRLRHILLLSILASFAHTGTAWAQDAGMSDVEIVDENDLIDSEKMLYSPGEAEVRYIPKAANTTVKDSIAIRVVEIPVREPKVQESATKPNEKQPAKAEDDSI